MSTPALKLPSNKAAEQALKALEALRELTRQRGPHQLSMQARSGPAVDVTVPPEAFELFLELLGQLAHGNAVTIMPVHAELTTQQAADLLNVSRPHLIRLLEAGELPHIKVGTHRRVRASDLMNYRARRDAEHESALDELAAEAQKHNLGY